MWRGSLDAPLVLRSGRSPRLEGRTGGAGYRPSRRHLRWLLRVRVVVERTHQNKKYRCASGSTFAGSQTSSSPSAVTAYVSGSTRMSGVASLWMSDFLPIPPRTFSTATSSFGTPSLSRKPLSAAAFDTNVTLVLVRALPNAPNIGR